MFFPFHGQTGRPKMMPASSCLCARVSATRSDGRVASIVDTIAPMLGQLAVDRPVRNRMLGDTKIGPRDQDDSQDTNFASHPIRCAYRSKLLKRPVPTPRDCPLARIQWHPTGNSASK
jgi:hypothetical protein